jgi:hypothetical protein
VCGRVDAFLPFFDALLMGRCRQPTAEIALYAGDAQRTLPAEPGLTGRGRPAVKLIR